MKTISQIHSKMNNLNDTRRDYLSFQLEPKVSCILEAYDEINWFQNSQSVRISCSNLKWHIDIYFFHYYFTLSLHRAVCGGDRYCLFWSWIYVFKFSFYYSGIAVLFYESPGLPKNGCTTFWLTEGMCPYSPVSLPAHLIQWEKTKARCNATEGRLIYNQIEVEH